MDKEKRNFREMVFICKVRMANKRADVCRYILSSKIQ